MATALWERHRLRTLRRSLAEVAEGARVGDGGALSIGGARISAVYFRAGYSPDDYPGDAEWRARCALLALGPFCLVCRAKASTDDSYTVIWEVFLAAAALSLHEHSVWLQRAQYQQRL